jgi:hypothetical protein
MLVRPNPLLGVELERQVLYRTMMKGKAEETKQHAEMIAPRGRTGNYAAGFELVQLSPGKWRLLNSDFAAHWVEWGSVHQAPEAIIRRSVRAVGLSLRESPKKG